jgi:hypothetical protein
VITEATTPPTTPPPETTEAPATTPASTTPASTSTTSTTTASTTIEVGFDPECSEAEPSRPPVTSDESALDAFGPIGTSPSIEIELPSGHSQRTGELMISSATAARVPGGVLLSVSSNSSGYFPGGMLVAVDHDGTLRWVRCFDQGALSVVVADVSSGPVEALVGISVVADNALPQYDWSMISLADGKLTRSLADAIEPSGIAATVANSIPLVSSAGVVIFGGPDHVIDVQTDRLVRLDVVEMTATEMRYPPEFDGRPSRELQLQLSADGQQLASMGLTPDNGHVVPKSVVVDGAWTTDPAARRESWPSTADYGFAPDLPALQKYDATFEVLWQRADVVMRPGEGFSAGVDGDVVVAESCVLIYAAEQPCEDFRLGGYSMEDGHTLWELDGYRSVTALGDGHAMVSVPSDGGEIEGWMLIDTRSGEIAAKDQHWDDPAEFDSQCCGGEEHFRVTRRDGVLVVFSDRFVRIWHPQDVAHPTVSLSLA